MVQINFAQKQVNAKVVYYGPGMSGKTTNLEIIHQRAPEQNRGDLTSISTDGDRTLFFDFMPLDLGTVAGMRTCFQIYTVPGQVYYNSTRKLVLQGVDGVVFVADSSASMVEENLESMRNLEENLNEYGKSLADLALVIQYNKRDLPDAMSIEQLDQLLNPQGVPTYEGVANTGQGVFPTLKALAGRVLEQIHQSYGSQNGGGAPPAEDHLSTGTTGFYPAQPQQEAAPAPQVGQAPQPQPIQHPQQPAPAHQHPQVTQPAAQHMPPAAAQTGFHPTPAAANPPAPNMGQQPPAHQNLGGDPMAKTTVHGPPQTSDDQGSQLRMARAPQAVAQNAPPVQPAQPQFSQARAMQVDPAAAPPAQQAPAARSFPVAQAPTNGQPGPRINPRSVARPTAAAGEGNKNAMFTGIFVVAALGAGAVLGRLVLTIF